MCFGRPHMNLQLVAAVPHPLTWATVWEGKLLSSVLSLWGYYCCRVSYQLASVDFHPCTPLPFSHSLSLSFSPCMNRLYLVFVSVLLSLSPSVSFPFTVLICVPLSFSLPVYWPCPHYRHNTAAAGCLSHSRHCRFLTRPTITHLMKWGGER